MPDSRTPEHRLHGWDDAFAALPLETSPADGWQRLQARLPAPAPARAPRRWRPAFAVAASVALAAVVPLALWRAQQAAVIPAPPVVQAAPAAADAMAEESRALPQATPGVADDPPGIAASPAVPADTRRAASPRPTRRATAPAHASDAASLDALYAESAQLEAVLAQLPDGGVQNATALTLSADLHDQVAYIDAALSQPALDRDTRDRLWRERVDTLRQLTGVQATPHWQVAQAVALPVSDTAIY